MIKFGSNINVTYICFIKQTNMKKINFKLEESVTFYVIVPDNSSKNPLIQKPGIPKPDIQARNLDEAISIAKTLYGNDVIVFEEYNPNW